MDRPFREHDLALASLTGLRLRLGGMYYGWWVLVSTFFIWFIAGGLFHHSAPIFFGPIRKDMGLSSTQASIIFSMQRAEGSITGPIVGPIVDRYGSKPLIIVGGIAAGLGYIGLHWTYSYWLFMLIFVGVVATGKSIGLGGHPLMSAINRWFVRRLSLALAISSTGGAIGGVVLLPLVILGVHTVGWRDVMLYAGIFTVIAIVPLGMMVHHSPERMGLQPEGLSPVTTGSQTQSSDAPDQRVDRDYSVMEAIRTRVWWLLLVATTIGIGATSAVQLHSVEIMVWKGMNEETAGFMVTLMMLLAIPIRLSAGALGMRYPLHWILLGGRISAALAMLALLQLDGTLGIFVYVVFMAIENGGGTLAFSAMGSFFGRKSYGSLMGYMASSINVGMMLSPIYAGRIVDTHDGSYTLVLWTFVPIYIVAGLLLFLMGKPRPLPRTRPGRA